MADVLLVSKPVVPPWNDSSKNLVRDLATALEGHRALVFGRSGVSVALGSAVIEPIYGAAAEGFQGFSPAVIDNLRVLRRLLLGKRAPLWHFFFAPNPRTSSVARAAVMLRRVACVQTVCSVPRDDVDPRRVLFGDRIVVLSRHTESRFLAAGISPERLRRIPPAIAPMDRASMDVAVERDRFGVPGDAPLIVYPGDLEFGGGAQRALELMQDLPTSLGAWLLLACRAKTAGAKECELALRARVESLGLSERVRFVGETGHIHGLLAAADLVVLPSETLYAKMDLPLVLIEAMALGRAAIVAADTPAEELAEDGGALSVPLQREALAEAAGRLLQSETERGALGARAAQAVVARYQPAPMARAYAAVYDELIST